VRFISVLVEGRVKTVRLSRAGTPVIVRIEQPGDLIGGLGPPLESLDVWKVQALETCQVLAWEAQTFDALCDLFPPCVITACRFWTSTCGCWKNVFSS
jgi:CRP-like cAMP-binding protein